MNSSISFSSPYSIANLAMPSSAGIFFSGKQMSSFTMSLSYLSCAWPISSKHVDSMGCKSQVIRVTTSLIITNMVKNWDIFTNYFRECFFHNPRIHKSMHQHLFSQITNTSISCLIKITSPIPAIRNFIYRNLGKKTRNCFRIKSFNLKSVYIHVPHFTHMFKISQLSGWEQQVSIQ